MFLSRHTSQYLCTPWGTVLLEKSTDSQLVKKFPEFLDPVGSILHSHVPVTCPYPGPTPSSPCPHIPLTEGPSLPIYAGRCNFWNLCMKFIYVTQKFSRNKNLKRKKIYYISLLSYVAFHKWNTRQNQSYIVYRMSREKWTNLRESVPQVELYRYNPKHLYPKLNGYGDNGQRSLKL